MAAFVFTPEERIALLANLFPGSHAAVDPIESFHWHSGRTTNCDTYLPHSSQALAIDLFGTLQTVDQDIRDRVLSALALKLGVNPAGNWKISLEWWDDKNRLKEWTPTQVDAIAESPHAVIFFESKFTEGDGGCCRQPLPDAAGIRQCNGNYAVQTNPKNGQTSPCALTGKGIRYWEEIPKVLRIQSSQHHVPCPFADSWYQWMRNVTLAHSYAEAHGKQAAFVVVYADHPGLAFPAVLKAKRWLDFAAALRPEVIQHATLSYQTMCELAVTQDTTGRAVFEQLAQWITNKIERGGSRTRG